MAQYHYNGLGQRIGVTRPGEVTRVYHYDLQGRLIAESTLGGTTLRQHIYVGDRPLAEEQGGAFGYVHTDHLGTPLKMTSGAGTVVWRADYKPFGEAEVDEDPDGNGSKVTMNLRFPGQYFDKETGLHYNYFRYYSPGIGRYLTPDPSLVYTADANISFLLYQQLQNPQDLNPYVYTKNNAINYMDPAGLYVPPSPTDIYMCILVMENHPELWKPFMDMEPKKDKMAHCALACQITREYGPWVAHNCALAKEVWDKYDPKGTFDPVDFKASLGGIRVGLDKCETCIEGCKETGWYW